MFYKNKLAVKYKLKADWQTARPKITESLGAAGYRIFQSFGLKFSEFEFDHRCSHHASEDCDCEIIVLLLYSNNYPIITILGHCTNGILEFGLGDCPTNYVEISEDIARAFLKAQKLLDKQST